MEISDYIFKPYKHPVTDKGEDVLRFLVVNLDMHLRRASPESIEENFRRLGAVPYCVLSTRIVRLGIENGIERTAAVTARFLISPARAGILYENPDDVDLGFLADISFGQRLRDARNASGGSRPATGAGTEISEFVGICALAKAVALKQPADAVKIITNRRILDRLYFEQKTAEIDILVRLPREGRTYFPEVPRQAVLHRLQTFREGGGARCACHD